MDAVGETPNIAARLQTLADAQHCLISSSTKRLISAAFDFQDLGFQELKGVTKPLHVYRVLAAKNIASRFEAAHANSLTPFIGRSTELSLLLDRWQKAKEGDGQVILLSGIPGVGKSRLIHELKSNIQHEPHFLLQPSVLAVSQPERVLSGHRANRTGGQTNSSRLRCGQTCQT